MAADPVTPGASQAAVPFAFCQRHGVLPRGEEDGAVVIACRAEPELAILLELRRHLGRPVRLLPLTPAAFDALLRQAYEESSSQTMQSLGELEGEADLARVAQELSEPRDLMESADDAPIIRLINALLTEAIKENASDIHIEPYERRLKVRFRVDGVLREVLEPPKALAARIASRVKVMARLDIAEKRLPQDGRIPVRIGGRAVDVRVSTFPTGHGERVVLRLLDKQTGRLELEQLGMPETMRDLLEQQIHRPNGIILVTGPTGSGKTTTLYAMLQRLNEASRNIMTVEDPIEYHLEGISQTQVSPRIELTFARGLRAILRQDPDVVMVGEIRDLETARVAVQASLTGHMVFSTLHTNSAIGAITRLRDMGVEPFLLASSLVAVLAQRLVRRLCPHCRREAAGEEFTHWQPVGCDKCFHLGYRGRTGIYELVLVDEALRHGIHHGAEESAMAELAFATLPTLREYGMSLARAGVTSLEEVFRVSRED